MNALNYTLPKAVSRDEWLTARKELLATEKALTKQRDQVNKARRALPMVEITKDYTFEGPQGKVKLADLFEGRHQLIVYHFMFEPGDPKVHVQNMFSAGPMVCVESYSTGKTLDGLIYENDYCWVFEVSNGKIDAMREYMDSHYTAKLFGMD